MLRVETVQFSKVASKPWDLFDYLGSASTMHSARKGKHRQHPYGGGDGDRSARSCNLSSNLLEVGFQRFWLSDLVSIFQLYIGNFISTRSSVVRFCLRVAKKCIWDEVTTWHHRFLNDFTCFYSLSFHQKGTHCSGLAQYFSVTVFSLFVSAPRPVQTCNGYLLADQVMLNNVEHDWLTCSYNC